MLTMRIGQSEVEVIQETPQMFTQREPEPTFTDEYNVSDHSDDHDDKVEKKVDKKKSLDQRKKKQQVVISQEESQPQVVEKKKSKQKIIIQESQDSQETTHGLEQELFDEVKNFLPQDGVFVDFGVAIKLGKVSEKDVEEMRETPFQPKGKHLRKSVGDDFIRKAGQILKTSVDARKRLRDVPDPLPEIISEMNGKDKTKKKKIVSDSEASSGSEGDDEPKTPPRITLQKTLPSKNPTVIDDSSDVSSDVSEPDPLLKMYPEISPSRPTILKTKDRNPHLNKRTVWTDAETQNLKLGVATFGEGNWSTILRRFSFNEKRDTFSLRDKWRNLQGRNKKKNEDEKQK